jgi:hypothetical protein
MPIEISTKVQNDRDQAAKQVNDANAQFEKLKADFQSSPERQLERDREYLQKLRSDPDFLNKKIGGSTAARDEEQSVISRIAVAESRAEAARLDAAIAGEKIDLPGMIETTVNGQLPMREMIAAVEPLVEHGVRTEMLKNFLAKGVSGGPDDRATEIAAAREWERRLLADPELQKRFLSGTDPELRRQFDCFGIYGPWPHER